jgi:hypothetical protein
MEQQFNNHANRVWSNAGENLSNAIDMLSAVFELVSGLIEWSLALLL